MKNLKVALVHDFLNQYGGAERVLEVLSEMFPEAPIYTLLHDPAKMRGKFAEADIRTSFLQKFPGFLRRRLKWLLPLMPTAPETFNLRDFDLVISSSSSFAKGIVVKPKTIHISYCHSPMRYAWDWNEKYLTEQGFGGKRKILARFILNYVRVWDWTAADRVDHFIANSETTRGRIKKYYRKESIVIYPPVEIAGLETEFPSGLTPPLEKGDKGGFFLIVSRLSPYKKIEAAIQAMNKLDLPLVIVGEGSAKYLKHLKSLSGPKIKFLGWKSDEDLKKIYAGCRAFIFPGEDDFGIAPVEAMSFGKPVIALKKGGATETIAEGVTGEFFREPTVEMLSDAVRRFMAGEKGYEAQKIREHAMKYSKEKFVENMKKAIGDILKQSQSQILMHNNNPDAKGEI